MHAETYGKIQIYTGLGKGKTTSALGLAIRAAGWGKKVAIVYFDKGGKNYGERKILDTIKNIDYFVTGLDRINKKGRFRFGVLKEDKKEAYCGLEIVKKLFKAKKHHIIILDEFNSTLGLKMFSLKDALALIKQKPKHAELILTGRNAHPKIIELADLVSEINPVKHYIKKGVRARRGIEY